MYLALLATLLAFCLSCLLFFHFRASSKQGLPPGSLGWPLLGETLEFLASKPTFTSQPFLEKRSARFGGTFKTHLFGQPFVVSTDPQMNRFILQNEGRLFQSCQPINAYSDILGKQTVGQTHGNLHKKLHEAAAQIGGLDAIRGHAFEFIQTLIMKRLPTWQDQIVHVQHEATYMVLCLLLHWLVSQDPEDPEMQRLQTYCNDVKSMLAFPFNVPGSGYSRHIQGRASLIRYIEDRIAKRRSLHDPGFKDILDALSRQEDEGVFTAKSNVVLDTIMGILFHGEETTAIAMSLVMKFLSDSPQALNQVKEENIAIRKRKRMDEQLSWEDYESMKFTRNVSNGIFAVPIAVFHGRRWAVDVVAYCSRDVHRFGQIEPYALCKDINYCSGLKLPPPVRTPQWRGIPLQTSKTVHYPHRLSNVIPAQLLMIHPFVQNWTSRFASALHLIVLVNRPSSAGLFSIVLPTILHYSKAC